MKKVLCLFLCFALVLCCSACSEGGKGASGGALEKSDSFDALLSYCEERSSGSGANGYTFSWNDTDSSGGEVRFTARIHQNRAVTISGVSSGLYTKGIEYQTKYTVSFTYDLQTNTTLRHRVDFEMYFTRMQDEFNYTPYTVDKITLCDTEASYNCQTKKTIAYYDSFSSQNNVIYFDDPNETLRSVSEDCFSQLENYFKASAGINLFS